jgi:hypothetical protein
MMRVPITVSVSHWDGKSLPYIDNLVNLIVMRDAGREIRDGELKRVLAPRGKIIAPEGTRIPYPVSRIGNGLVMCTKPVPSDIDEWTYFMHGPDNNPVARDSKLDCPEGLQWIESPLWTRDESRRVGRPIGCL